MTVKHTWRTGVGLGAALACLSAAPALATEGYFALGYGPVQRALGGTGVAYGEDAMAATVNPATVASIGKELSLGIQAFMPHRGYTGTGTYFVAPGEVWSRRNFFLVPNVAYNLPLSNGGVLNFAAYGNGGMDTSYPALPNSAYYCGGYGVFCAGSAGVDLQQLFLSVTYAQKIGNLSFGIAPTIVLQGFKATGLDAFGGFSIDPTNLTGNGRDWSHGAGLRVGMTYDISSTLSLGITAQTKMNMSRFKKYAGLFEGGGAFDIPATATVGLAWKASPTVTLLMDYQRIWYSGVPAVSDPFPNGMNPLGAPGGPGFGWDDVNVIKIGAEWRASDRMTWRVGYAHSSNPVGSNDVTINILAPGIVTDHFTAGGSFRMSDRDRIDFAIEYAPKHTVSGTEVTTMGATPGVIELKMHQVSASFGWTRTF